jgi:TatD DNase family protein
VAGCDPHTNIQALELCRDREFLVPCLGLHPTFTDAFDELDRVEEQLRVNEPPAVGEIGLDHYHVDDAETQSRQREVFERMLGLAEDLDRPVVVHSREAERKTVDILERYSVEGILHCFNGSVELAERAAESGLLVGVTTQVLYSSGVESIAESVPLDSIVLETDSPFLYPDGRNEPSKVEEAAEKVAEIRNIDRQEVVESTTRNSARLYGVEM